MKYFLALHLPFIGLIVCFFSGLYIGVAIYALDIVKRTREYFKLRRKTGCTRIYDLYKGSYCQRSVIEVLFPESKKYYKSIGYSWYNILPDAWVSRPLGMFSFKWWKKFLV
jgi:hypothetical protein